MACPSSPVTHPTSGIKTARTVGLGVALTVLALLTAGCATTATTQQQVAPPVSVAQQREAQRSVALPAISVLKRKVAIGRFTNETRYGRTFQVDASLDPLGKQASDMLINRLQQSGKFIVIERTDLDKVIAEQQRLGESNLTGVDALIFGSVTEFGRSTTGKAGFLSNTKLQTAHAKVELRMVDVRTGVVFFTASGSGDANTESGEIAGFGNKADYDATLNDRAIGAAISDVQSAIVSKLTERPWRTRVLKVDGSQILISGGAHQGLTVGTKLTVARPGDTVKNPQTGFKIELPATPIAEIQVMTMFGDSDITEGSITQVVSGSIAGSDPSTLVITEFKETAP
jgi:curli biogenesis system outer membrane secretion channel CsgG